MSDVSTKAIAVRLEAIEREIADLKQKLIAGTSASSVASLEGVWKDIHISDQEIEEVKRAWSKKLDDLL